jgi:hypothetical protein
LVSVPSIKKPGGAFGYSVGGADAPCCALLKNDKEGSGMCCFRAVRYPSRKRRQFASDSAPPKTHINPRIPSLVQQGVFPFTPPISPSRGKYGGHSEGSFAVGAEGGGPAPSGGTRAGSADRGLCFPGRQEKRGELISVPVLTGEFLVIFRKKPCTIPAVCYHRANLPYGIKGAFGLLLFLLPGKVSGGKKRCKEVRTAGNPPNRKGSRFWETKRDLPDFGAGASFPVQQAKIRARQLGRAKD